MSIYTPQNIARSRARAQAIREAVERGELDESWRNISVVMEAYADEREQAAAMTQTTFTAGFFAGMREGVRQTVRAQVRDDTEDLEPDT